jgi:hypothetical protein
VTWKVTVGEKGLEYRLSKLKDSEDYVLKVSDQPYYFRLSQLDAQGVLDAERGKLLKGGGEAGEDAGGGKTGPAAAPGEQQTPAVPAIPESTATPAPAGD